jgi:response regulator NasT
MKTCQSVKEILSKAGYRVDAVCHSGTEVRRFSSSYDGGLVICAPNLPDMTAEGLYNIMPYGFDMLTLLSNKYEFPENQEILCLLKPITKYDMVSTVDLLDKLSQRNPKSKVPANSERTDKEKKMIEEAKICLINRYSMTEKTAHRFIQKRSMDSGLKMEKTAEIILNY